MKYLVTYYSRTGNNRTIGEAIATSLSADIDEITDKKGRKGIGGWLRAGRDAMGKKITEIQVTKNPEEYDAIILGTPIWAGSLPPAMRTYLSTYNLKGKRVAFFICSGGDKQEDVISELHELTVESEHLGTFGITEKQFKAGDYEAELMSFLERLKL